MTGLKTTGLAGSIWVGWHALISSFAQQSTSNSVAMRTVRQGNNWICGRSLGSGKIKVTHLRCLLKNQLDQERARFC